MATDGSLVADAAAYAGEWLGYLQRSLRVPGLVAAVRHQDDLVLNRAYGQADVESGTEMRTDHIFRIASHSKTFTATALMLLVERGALRLDDPVGQRISWLADSPNSVGTLTIRQLLTHSAGLIRDGADAAWWDLRLPFHDDDSLREAVLTQAPIYKASERFKYSNIGYSLLGRVVAEASGQPYKGFVQAEIVDRLGLQSTGPELDMSVADRMATGYSTRRYGQERFAFPKLHTAAMASATGFYATAEDLCRYGAAHFMGNEELLTDESKREMQHEWWEVRGRDPRHYGYGFNVAKVGGRRLIGHGGGFPGFITYTCIDPVDRLVVTVLTNAIDGPAEAMATGIIKLINLATGEGSTDEGEGRPPPSDTTSLDRFTGRFFSLWTVVDILRLGDRLVAIDPETTDPTGDVMELEVVDDRTLRITQAAGYASAGERVRFDFDANGRAVVVQYAGSRLLPWEVYEARTTDLASASPVGGAFY